MNIIPEEILKNSICSNCKKYLSVKPVKIYPNREIKCGRCVEENDTGVESFYGLFAENVFFPCINRYEGCNQLLRYTEVENHERNCPTEDYLCIICNDFIGSAYELLLHFQISHPNYILPFGEFPVNIDVEEPKWYIYCRGNFIFLVNVQCDHMSEELLLSICFVGPKEKGNYLKYQFVFKKFGKDAMYSTKLQDCPAFGENINFHRIKFNAFLSKEKSCACQIKINSYECEGLIKLTLYQLKKKQKTNNLKEEKRLSSLNNHAGDLTTPAKLKLSCASDLTHVDNIELNVKLEIHSILRSPIRPTFRRKLQLDETKLETVVKNGYTKILLSDDLTSVVVMKDNTKMEFEMICFGCKQNLPILTDSSLRIRDMAAISVDSLVLYGCACPNNLVCENCYKNWNFVVCKNGHQYDVKLLESTILTVLKYYSWMHTGPYETVQEALSSVVQNPYRNDLQSIGGYDTYLHMVNELLKSNRSLIEIGIVSYYLRNRFASNRQFHLGFTWLCPFFTHSIQLSDLFNKTFIAVVDTIIVIEKFANRLSTAFKLQIYNSEENKSIISLLRITTRIGRIGYSFRIYKGDFQILNNDISNTVISFRVI